MRCLQKGKVRLARGAGSIHAWQGCCGEAGKEKKGPWLQRRGEGKAGLHLRTGCVLNSECALISPTPLPLMADSRMEYVVSGLRPTTVTTPSVLAAQEKTGEQGKESVPGNMPFNSPALIPSYRTGEGRWRRGNQCKGAVATQNSRERTKQSNGCRQRLFGLTAKFPAAPDGLPSLASYILACQSSSPMARHSALYRRMGTPPVASGSSNSTWAVLE